MKKIYVVNESKLLIEPNLMYDYFKGENKNETRDVVCDK